MSKELYKKALIELGKRVDLVENPNYIIKLALEKAIANEAELKKPPTEDEVCKALSDYTERKIQFEDGFFQEQYDSGNWYMINLHYIIEDKKYDLITMIVKFYESLEEDLNV